MLRQFEADQNHNRLWGRKDREREGGEGDGEGESKGVTKFKIVKSTQLFQK